MYFVVVLPIFTQHSYSDMLSCCVYQLPLPSSLLDLVSLHGHTTKYLLISVDGLFLGPCFQQLQKNSFERSCTSVFMSICSHFSWVIPRRGMAGSHNRCLFNSWKKLPYLSIVIIPFYISISCEGDFQCLCSSPTLGSLSQENCNVLYKTETPNNFLHPSKTRKVPA